MLLGEKGSLTNNDEYIFSASDDRTTSILNFHEVIQEIY
jgi:hypothetical protein